LSRLFEQLRSLVSDVNYPLTLELVSDIWSFNASGVYWNEDNNLDDMLTGDGGTYTCEYHEGWHKQDGCYFFNCDNGCGDTITRVFLEDKLIEE
jgi:hypothetical protein